MTESIKCPLCGAGAFTEDRLRERLETTEQERDEACAALRLCVPFVNEVLSMGRVGRPLWEQAEKAKAAARKALGEA